ncbi:hypothetical protein TWF191_003150 [Orbilia oligospora]|uniref:Alpha-type protein kinase domain-containing protein n=1 Tax=Orbilia oligospora TaxID=2813651 RepID=A0A7C8Q8S5_ORBOL|nr:hypothetical protein TWF191_003150 [Orbilia oligospora]
MAYSRTNNSTRANIDLSKLHGSGTFKYVYAGTYTAGARKGQPCVAKEFKSGCVVEDHYFDEEMNICAKSQEIIDEFNEAGILNQEVYLNTPEIWKYIGRGSSKEGQKALLEPMIENFEKFNSNSGWALSEPTGWAAALQSLSHFSYENSGGQLLLCDLQGGIYNDGFVLTDPVIMSRAQNCGPADLGMDGIMSFFQRHRCVPANEIFSYTSHCARETFSLNQCQRGFRTSNRYYRPRKYYATCQFSWAY